MTIGDVLKKLVEFEKREGRQARSVALHPRTMAELVNSADLGSPIGFNALSASGTEWIEDPAIPDGEIRLS